MAAVISQFPKVSEADKGISSKPSQGTKVAGFFEDESSLEVLKKFVSDSADAEQMIFRGNLVTAVRMIELLKRPDILLAEADNLSSGIIAESVQDLIDRDIHVTLVGHEDSAHAYRRALDLGAKDYIAKPITAEKLRQSIELAQSRTAGRKRKICRVLGVISSSGAAGGTTVAANTAWLLATATQRSVALLDPDRFLSDLPLSFDIEPARELREFFEIKQRSDSAVHGVIPARPADRLAVYAMDDDFEADQREFNPHAVMTALQHSYDVIALDLSIEDVRDNHSILSFVTEAIIVTTPTFASLRNCNRILRFLQKQYPDMACHTIINHTMLKAECSEADIKRALEQTSGPHLPYVDRQISLAKREGRPLATVAPRHAWTRSLRKFIEKELGFKLAPPRRWWHPRRGKVA
jgi:Flp pilus assembly CpaE family ATPase